MDNSQIYDVLIIGGGLAGLECGTILSKEGMKVCIVEKNKTIGGCLQSYLRDGHIFDTGLHYVGSMGTGDILHQFFKYFDILDKISYKRMDSNFDIIYSDSFQREYLQGFENFENKMIEYYPLESSGIRKYVSLVKDIFGGLSVENLRKGTINEDRLEYMGVSASSIIDNCVSDKELRNVLAGTVSLYGGVKDYSPFYHHAMIVGSNIDGAYRFEGGTQKIAEALADQIRKNGGDIICGNAVTGLICKNNKIDYLELKNGQKIYSKHFISSLHPLTTFSIVSGESVVRKAFINRLKSLANSVGFFTVDIILKKNTVKYINKNYHIHVNNEFWHPLSYKDGYESKNVFMSMRIPDGNSDFAEEVTLLNPMYIDEVSKWIDTPVGKRGQDYVDFKSKRIEQILEVLKVYAPDIVKNIEKIYTSTPLTYLNYTGTIAGSAYGILKNCNNPLLSLMPVRTKIENLLQTGQNINVHGALGVSLTSAITCSEFIGYEYLAKKIGNI